MNPQRPPTPTDAADRIRADQLSLLSEEPAEPATFAWPTPPYAAYRHPTDAGAPPLCDVEGHNGQSRQCALLSLNGAERLATIQVPPSKVPMPLRFSMFRRITAKSPLVPTDAPGAETDTVLSELLQYRPAVHYRLVLQDGAEDIGLTVGHVENSLGLFLFPPLDERGTVQRRFVPREAYSELHLGESIGHVLVAHQAVTPEQVELAAREQENIRNRKLGDYLVIKEIVTADQLLGALEEQSRMPMVRIGEALTALGLISDTQLGEALERQKSERTVPLGELLVKSGQLTRDNLQTALARKMGFPVIDLRQFPIDPQALRKVPYAMARRLKALPVLWRDGLLVVATEDPTRRAAIEELEFTTQSKVVGALAGGKGLGEALRESYARLGENVGETETASGSAGELANADKLLESLEQGSADQDDTERPIEQSDNSLVRLINSMITEAHQRGVSDIHIETYATRRKVRIRFRKDGVLTPYMELPHTYRSALVARLKIMCDLDIAERRKPQDGKIDFSRFAQHHKLELRVATIPTQNGAEDVVMRLLASAKPLPMAQLGLSAENAAALSTAIVRPYGMVLCVGPTGSGKTTTLHSVLAEINTPDRKIWTAEDPIEITNPDLRQVQVNPKIDWTFAKALRAFLRADPDVIMVGEIRDHDTAQMAIEASLTGHLVLSTLHTNSAPETVTRLLDMGMDPFNFADSLLAVLAQRLVRQLCPRCKRAEPAEDGYLQELVADYRRAFPDALKPEPDSLLTEWTTQHGQEGRLMRYHPVGCEHCQQTGLRGRIGLHELLTVEAHVRRLIQTNGRPEDIQHTAMAQGHFRTLRQDGIAKVLAGLTTIDEVRANCNG